MVRMSKMGIFFCFVCVVCIFFMWHHVVVNCLCSDDLHVEGCTWRHSECHKSCRKPEIVSWLEYKDSEQSLDSQFSENQTVTSVFNRRGIGVLNSSQQLYIIQSDIRLNYAHLASDKLTNRKSQWQKSCWHMPSICDVA